MSLDLNLKVRTSKKVYCFLNATSYDILLQCAKLNRKRCIRTSEVGSRNSSVSWMVHLGFTKNRICVSIALCGITFC